jgi:N6-L-threonylcarbamoyladenine synthase
LISALVARVALAVGRERLQRLAIGGGVAANSRLRERLSELCGDLGVQLWAPPLSLCTDNAAMIGAAARFTEPLEYPDYLTLDAAARL